MQSIHCLSDLKKKLNDFGVEVLESHGWYLITSQGKWTMCSDQVYLNDVIITDLKQMSALALKRTKVKTKIPDAAPPENITKENKQKSLTSKPKKRKLTKT